MKMGPKSLILMVILFIGWLAFAETEANATVFAGTGVGAIPDGNTGTPPQYGTPLVISFSVSGMNAPISSLELDLTVNHTWVGDVDMVLTSPGGVASQTLVSRIGVTTAGSFGDSSNYSGTYLFSDSSSTNIWTVATTACGDACNVTAGTYRTTAPGMTGQTNPAPFTNLTAPFTGLSAAQINGTWTLTVRDAAQADTGSVTAANLNIITPTAAGVSVSGRVQRSGGAGINRTVVKITDLETGETRSTYTGSFGNFSFTDLAVGRLYMLTVEHPKYNFANNSQIFKLVDNANEFEFIADDQ